ncbi:hypothetical protein [Streptomyces lasiicapitis]|uniref:hypothetical protein n=1 Tax=Streptomyces lasiicapitis TaxID=1923961 RepID=UPI00365AC0A6
MPMPRIPYRLSPAAMAVIGTAASPRLSDPKNGVIATDWETGAEIWQMTVMVIDEGRADSMLIQVPETGLPKDLTVGSTVRLTNLVASPWANASVDKRGQARLSEGVTYRAESLELLAAAPIPSGAPAPAVAVKAAPAATPEVSGVKKAA